MAEGKPIRLSKAAKEFNIGITTIVEFFKGKGYVIENNPNTKLSPEHYDILLEEFQSEKTAKEESRKVGLEHSNLDAHADKQAKEEYSIIDIEPKDLFIKQNTTELIDIVKEEKKEKPQEVKKEEISVEKLEVKKEEIKAEEPQIKEVETKVKEKVAPEKPIEKSLEVEKTIEKTEESIKILGKIDLEKLETKKKPEIKKTDEQTDDKTNKKPDIEKKKIVEKTDDEIVIEKVEKPIDEIKEEKSAIEAVEETIVEEKDEIIVEDETIEAEGNFLKTEYEKLSGPIVLGKMELPKKPKPSEKKTSTISAEEKEKRKKKRKRIKKTPDSVEGKTTTRTDVEKSKFKPRDKKKKTIKPVVSEEDIQKQIKDTLSKLTSTGKSKASKHRRQKREIVSRHISDELEKIEAENKTIKVTEFVTANELATMMDIPVVQIISTCMSIGMFVSINQRLDAETLSIVAEEFGFDVEFISVEVQEAIQDVEDKPEDLLVRNAIVTVMGHVDHGKTSLLDFIRHANVIAGEAGGITQHIGAYEVTLEGGQSISFLDTPGHEAFTAMRARGAKITDVAVIVVAADDHVMPQTKEAINHAQAAGVPIVFAINKIDKPGANPERVKEELANMNILVEDWGGKYQSQEISAKKGINIDLLLEKILLEAEMLDLKANPSKLASGTVLESSLDKGRGYVAKIIVQNGTLKIGDMVLAGYTYGKVKAMYNERNSIITEAGPSTPVLLLGLNGAPQAGDGFNVMLDEKETKSIASKRLQLQREQGLRTQKHITLDEIGRRLAIGDFKELNVIVKGDVDGSVEALSDSLIKLSNEEIQVNIIHKSVGQISETDVLLASASDAVIIGFQVRPSLAAKKLAESEQIDIRLYSVIYQAIDELKAAMEGMLSPDIEEKITCNVEIRAIYKITKVGTIAGCYVLDGKITRNSKIRIIRDGIVVYTGTLGSLKRFKDDVKEVAKGFECGLNIDNFNDIKVGDIVEGYTEIEVKRKL
ncbi:MAG: translation initiation factor IF-2 [Saprospiraceae bacterium]|nr:translation initiation factor IF-2 [Saprospiraceae bacterium]